MQNLSVCQLSLKGKQPHLPPYGSLTRDEPPDERASMEKRQHWEERTKTGVIFSSYKNKQKKP